MASLLTKLKSLPNTRGGRAVTWIVYAVMFLLVCIYFTGNGEFIYEL